MEHTIFVPVPEFLENGGVLEGQRELYSLTHSAHGTGFSCIGWYEPSLNTDNVDLITVSKADRSFRAYIASTFVQVECKPIYK